ncbi:MAG: hypothetical protein LC620_03930 [Halobacteriales archaeon]|nr:hypothetical protein [Halobacteriales archaeon]
MPWEQGETDEGKPSSHVPAGADPTTTASGGSSKSVPPPSQGPGVDGLGQGSGASTVKAAQGMMPPASQTVTGTTPAAMSSMPPRGATGALAKQDLEQAHPEGMEATRPGSAASGTPGLAAEIKAPHAAPSTADRPPSTHGGSMVDPALVDALAQQIARILTLAVQESTGKVAQMVGGSDKVVAKEADAPSRQEKPTSKSP